MNEKTQLTSSGRIKDLVEVLLFEKGLEAYEQYALNQMKKKEFLKINLIFKGSLPITTDREKRDTIFLSKDKSSGEISVEVYGDEENIDQLLNKGNIGELDLSKEDLSKLIEELNLNFSEEDKKITDKKEKKEITSLLFTSIYKSCLNKTIKWEEKEELTPDGLMDSAAISEIKSNLIFYTLNYTRIDSSVVSIVQYEALLQEFEDYYGEKEDSDDEISDLPEAISLEKGSYINYVIELNNKKKKQTNRLKKIDDLIEDRKAKGRKYFDLLGKKRNTKKRIDNYDKRIDDADIVQKQINTFKENFESFKDEKASEFGKEFAGAALSVVGKIFMKGIFDPNGADVEFFEELGKEFGKAALQFGINCINSITGGIGGSALNGLVGMIFSGEKSPMEKQLNRVEGKIDKVLERISELENLIKNSTAELKLMITSLKLEMVTYHEASKLYTALNMHEPLNTLLIGKYKTYDISTTMLEVSEVDYFIEFISSLKGKKDFTFNIRDIWTCAFGKPSAKVTELLNGDFGIQPEKISSELENCYFKSFLESSVKQKPNIAFLYRALINVYLTVQQQIEKNFLMAEVCSEILAVAYNQEDFKHKKREIKAALAHYHSIISSENLAFTLESQICMQMSAEGEKFFGELGRIYNTIGDINKGAFYFMKEKNKPLTFRGVDIRLSPESGILLNWKDSKIGKILIQDSNWNYFCPEKSPREGNYFKRDLSRTSSELTVVEVEKIGDVFGFQFQMNNHDDRYYIVVNHNYSTGIIANLESKDAPKELTNQSFTSRNRVFTVDFSQNGITSFGKNLIGIQPSIDKDLTIFINGSNLEIHSLSQKKIIETINLCESKSFGTLTINDLGEIQMISIFGSDSYKHDEIYDPIGFEDITDEVKEISRINNPLNKCCFRRGSELDLLPPYSYPYGDSFLIHEGEERKFSNHKIKVNSDRGFEILKPKGKDDFDKICSYPYPNKEIRAGAKGLRFNTPHGNVYRGVPTGKDGGHGITNQGALYRYIDTQSAYSKLTLPFWSSNQYQDYPFHIACKKNDTLYYLRRNDGYNRQSFETDCYWNSDNSQMRRHYFNLSEPFGEENDHFHIESFFFKKDKKLLIPLSLKKHNAHDLGFFPTGVSKFKIKIDYHEKVKISCKVHSGQMAYLNISDHHFFSKAGTRRTKFTDEPLDLYFIFSNPIAHFKWDEEKNKLVFS